MTANLSFSWKLLAFNDDFSSNNPTLKNFDWSQSVRVGEVRNPTARAVDVAPGQALLLFDGTRALATDVSTSFDLELVSGSSDRYRLRWVAGTNPVFRTDRALALSGMTVTVSVNPNGTAVFTSSAPAFGSVVSGDVLWIPGTDEIGTQPLNSLNRGFWTVLAATSTSVTVQRSGDFQGFAEGPTTITANDQVRAHSSTGVQVGDVLEILAGFVSSSRRSYEISVVTPSYLEFVSTLALAEESSVEPGAAGIFVYTEGKRLVHVESDQDCVVRANGDVGSSQKVRPWSAGDQSNPGVYMRSGITWSLSILNESLSTAHIMIITVE